MSMTVTGRATIYGADGGIVYTGVAATNQYIENVTFSQSAAKEELRDGYGELQGQGWGDKRDHLTIDFTPVAASGTNTLANAATACTLPPLPAKITLSGFLEAASGTINGYWYYDSPENASLKYTRGGKATMTLQLWRKTGSGGTSTWVDAMVLAAS